MFNVQKCPKCGLVASGALFFMVDHGIGKGRCLSIGLVDTVFFWA